MTAFGFCCDKPCWRSRVGIFAANCVVVVTTHLFCGGSGYAVLGVILLGFGVTQLFCMLHGGYVRTGE